MRTYRKVLVTLVVFFSWVVVHGVVAGSVMSQNPGETRDPAKQAPKRDAAKNRTIADPYAKEVSRRGNTIIVSKAFAEAVKKDNALVLSKVAIKQRVDENGKVIAYELIQIDRGSVVEKMGLKTGDRLTAVNGIPAKDLLEHRKPLEQGNRFVVDMIRKGKPLKLAAEIR
jgi:type II secretory pathway component PulC